MKPSEFRKHPVTQLLAHSAMGELPTEKELDQLELPPTDRRRVSDAATVIVGIKAGGENKTARDHAEDSADRIVNGLADEFQRHDYLKPADETPNDPQGLADMVSRSW